MRRIPLLLALGAIALAYRPALGRTNPLPTIDMVFDGDAGDVAGDVNADGLATAADVSGVLLGQQSPTEPGPFRVGVTQIAFTKQSVTTGAPRPLETDIWYPTDETAGEVDAALGGVVGAPLAAEAQSLPLVIFSHGSCGFPEQSLFLTPLIASYGFIVAAPPHPGNELYDFPNCGTPAAQVDSFLNREADITFVIDSLLALNGEPGSFLYGAIDPSRIGMSGHSFGGQTTLRVCADDPRVIAGLALAPALSPVQSLVSTISIPMMVQDGSVDTVTPFDANARATYDLLAPPKVLVDILDTGHFAFSDGCFPGLPDCSPGTLSQAQAHLYVLRYAIPFLLHRVAGDDRFDAFLAPAADPPGVVVTEAGRRQLGGRKGTGNFCRRGSVTE